MRRFGLFCLVFGLLSTVGASYGKPSLPKTAGTIVVGGEGGWDLLTVDTVSHRLYVSHATKVVVIDLDSQKVVREISNLVGVHGIAIDREFNHGFISCSGDSSVAVFDLANDSVIAKVKLPFKKQDVIIFDSFTKSIFVFNAANNNASQIDVKSLKIIFFMTVPVVKKVHMKTLNGFD